jgi:hypothetical protein
VIRGFHARQRQNKDPDRRKPMSKKRKVVVRTDRVIRQVAKHFQTTEEMNAYLEEVYKGQDIVLTQDSAEGPPKPRHDIANPLALTLMSDLVIVRNLLIYLDTIKPKDGKVTISFKAREAEPVCTAIFSLKRLIDRPPGPAILSALTRTIPFHTSTQSGELARRIERFLKDHTSIEMARELGRYAFAHETN